MTPAEREPVATPVRARDLGIPLDGEPGPGNAITDVPGVQVGHVTLVEGEGPLRVGHGPVRTGVTALLPLGRDGVGQACPAGWCSLNGNGEMTGTAWIEESGGLALPVLLTNTHAVGTCHRGMIDWLAARYPELGNRWHLPVVAETWDGYLNDVNGDHVHPEHAVAALDAATGGPVAEGAVGGGTGMTCYGFKGGSGTASRRVAYGPDTYHVGALVQANFGSRAELVVAGVPVGRRLGAENPEEDDPGWLAPPGSGSVIVLVGTDAPLLPGQCKALARRVPLGLARTGTTGSHFSGDLFLAFSTANAGALNSEFPTGGTSGYQDLRFVPWGQLDVFYAAVVRAVEEAVLNALVAGRTTVGRDGHRAPGLPHDRLRALLVDRPA